jgi:hypothetical protein
VANAGYQTRSASGSTLPADMSLGLITWTGEAEGRSKIATAAWRSIVSLGLARLSSSASASERQQTCQGKNGGTFECGRDSAAVLLELTRDRRVECAQRDYDRYDRVVAVCRTESGELNAALARRGWAVDYTKYSRGRYQSDEERARGEGLGIWAGRFELPWDWRHRH